MLACDVSVCPLKGAVPDEDPKPILHQRLIFATIMFPKKPLFAMQCCQMLKTNGERMGDIRLEQAAIEVRVSGRSFFLFRLPPLFIE